MLLHNLKNGKLAFAMEIRYTFVIIADNRRNWRYEKAKKKTNRITFQAMEAFIHNLNTMHSRAGAQVPFSSINFGTDTSPEGRMVSKNLLLSLEKGLGNGGDKFAKSVIIDDNVIENID